MNKRALVALAGVVGAVVVAVPTAHATPGPWDDPRLNAAEQDYVNHGHRNICYWLDAEPGDAGVAGVVSRVQAVGFSYREAVDIINVSVAKTCPGHLPRLTHIGNLQPAARSGHSRPLRVPVPPQSHWRFGGGILV